MEAKFLQQSEDHHHHETPGDKREQTAHHREVQPPVMRSNSAAAVQRNRSRPTVDTLLKPENKGTLTKVLTYHVVSAGSRART